MQNSMVMFTFSVFDWKYLFAQIWSKKSKLSVWAEISLYTNLNMQNYVENMCLFIFSVFDQKNPFWTNLVKKVKIVSLSWNFLQRLIWISRIQWWCSIFLFLTINIFLGQIWCKNSKLFVRSEIWYKD